MVWAIMFVALMILGRYGVDGLKDAGMVGAMIVAAFGIHSFLNTFWKPKEEGKEQPEKHFWDGPGFRLTRSKRGFSLSSNSRRSFSSPPDETALSTRHYAEEDPHYPSTAW
ncbi:MAG TPA: hypothetical protein VM182_12725 [Terriglobia bacterium]|nr:hypothetical protein [Terriglobia bacterium]